MTGSPQQTFDAELGLPAIPELAPAPGSALEATPERYCPPGLIGLAEARHLQADGWQFCEGGSIQLANCCSAWAKRGDEYKAVFLADPDIYPELWPEEPNAKLTDRRAN